MEECSDESCNVILICYSAQFRSSNFQQCFIVHLLIYPFNRYGFMIQNAYTYICTFMHKTKMEKNKLFILMFKTSAIQQLETLLEKY